MINPNEHPIPRRNIIWSWVLQVYSSISTWALWLWSLLPSFKSNHPALKTKIAAQQLDEISSELDDIISEFLTLQYEIKNVMQPHGKSFAGFYREMNPEHRIHLVLLRRFLYFIAIEGEDNQNKAEAMLRKYPQLVSMLISMKYPNVIDAAGRRFLTPMSGYGYAYWSGDARFRHMMEHYMDEETKAAVLMECQAIATHGVTFTLNGEVFTESHHFDFQSLINAYHVCIDAATVLMDANNLSDAAWAPVRILWLNIGKELAKVPTNVAQEYCSTLPFVPVPTFREPNVARTTRFYNWMMKTYDSWFTSVGGNSDLGSLFSIVKGAEGARMSLTGYSRQLSHCELAAVTAMCEVKTVAALKQTLEYDLQPMAPVVTLTV